MKPFRSNHPKRLAQVGSRFVLERRAPRRARLVLAVVGALGFVFASGCDLLEDDDGGGKPKIKSADFSTTEIVVPNDVTSSTSGAVTMSASVPEDSVAMGIVVYVADDTELTFIEHAGQLLGGDDNITGPGGAVPLSFNTINGEPSPSSFNNQASAVHFPNDGRPETLDSGTYRFPVGAADADSGNLLSRNLNGIVLYKTATSQTPTLKLNVFVLNGVDDSIVDDASAQSDTEIEGAVAVLENVYGGNESIGVNVDITVEYLDDATNCLSEPGLISAEDEQFCLLSTYPTVQTDDAMNIFVISSLDYIDEDNPGGGVIGLAAGIPGPFNEQGFSTSGTMAEYQGDGDGTILGFTLAHEFGHFLGLFHTSQTNGSATAIVGEDPIDDTDKCKTTQVLLGLDECPDFGNLMFPFVDNEDDPPVSTGQGNVVKYNPGITVP